MYPRIIMFINVFQPLLSSMDAIEQLKRVNPDFLRDYNQSEPPKQMDVPDEITRLWAHFKRYVELNDKRVVNLQKALQAKETELKGIKEFVDKIKDKETVAKTREQVYQMNNQSARVMTVPIDRNGVAPSDVDLNQIFYNGR
jgi:hypothetical protein